MSDTIISFNEDVIHTELKDLVRTRVAEALWGQKFLLVQSAISTKAYEHEDNLNSTR